MGLGGLPPPPMGVVPSPMHYPHAFGGGLGLNMTAPGLFHGGFGGPNALGPPNPSLPPPRGPFNPQIGSPAHLANPNMMQVTKRSTCEFSRI